MWLERDEGALREEKEELRDCWLVVVVVVVGCTGDATRCTGDLAALEEDPGREECCEEGAAITWAGAGRGYGVQTGEVGQTL